MIFYVDSPWCPDPGYSMQLYFDSKSFVNYSNYSNASVDKLLAETASTADDQARLDMMADAQKIMMDEAPWTFIAYPNYTMARKADLMGWTYYTSNNIRFQDFRRGWGAMGAGPEPTRALEREVTTPEATARAAGSGPLLFFLAVLRARPELRAWLRHRRRRRVAGAVRAACSRPSIRPSANPTAYLQPPGWPHLMGTDATGHGHLLARRLRAAHRPHHRARRHGDLGGRGLAAGRRRRLLSERARPSGVRLRVRHACLRRPAGVPGVRVRDRDRGGVRAEPAEHHASPSPS